MAEDVFKIAEAFVAITMRDQGYDRGASKLKTKVEKDVAGIHRSFRLTAGSGLGSAGVLGKLLGAAAIGKFAIDSVKAAAVHERAMDGVKAALASTGQEVEHNAAGIAAFSKSMQDSVGVSDEVVQKMIAQSIAMGSSADQAKEITRAGLGLGKMFGSVEHATNAVTKASQGYWEQMHERFPMLRQFKTDQEKMAAVQKMAARGFEQQKMLQGDLIGSTQQLGLAFGDLKESIGGLAVGPATSAIQALTELTKLLTPGAEDHATLITSVTDQILTLEKRVYEAAAAIAHLFGDDAGVKYFEGKIKDTEDAIQGLKDAENQRLNDRIKGEAKNAQQTDITTHAIKKQKHELAGTWVSGMEAYLKLIQKEWFKTADAATSAQAAQVAASKGAASGGPGAGGTVTPPGSKPPAGSLPSGGNSSLPPDANQGSAHSELHDREWHRRRLQQRRNQLDSAFQHDNKDLTDHDQGMGKKVQQWQKDAQESFDIAVHGTKARADQSRMDSRDYKATRERIRRQREEIMSHGRPDQATYDLAGPEGQKKFDEQKKFNEEQANRMAQAEMKAYEERSQKRSDAFKPKIDKEKRALDTPIDQEATDLRKGLQDKFGQPNSGNPIKVETPESKKLLEVLTHLDQVLPKLGSGSTFK